jgi:hypothetical protein
MVYFIFTIETKENNRDCNEGKYKHDREVPF